MTILSGAPDVLTNTTYVAAKHRKRLEDEYDLVSPPENPPGGYVNVVPLPPPPFHQPLPAVPQPEGPPENTDRAEEVMYEHIPGDK